MFYSKDVQKPYANCGARPMPSDADRCDAMRCVALRCVQFVRRSVIATRTRTLANDDAYMASTRPGTTPRTPTLRTPPSTAVKKSYRRAKCSEPSKNPPSLLLQFILRLAWLLFWMSPTDDDDVAGPTKQFFRNEMSWPWPPTATLLYGSPTPACTAFQNGNVAAGELGRILRTSSNGDNCQHHKTAHGPSRRG
ncbi:GM26106 [Drosophila sechellia]|uniref:GM26106 n=1 Tax=Drosophila sechellia TaxID=7238 RepID=B4HIA6_DROSE|nr:GM26106 [Drosophila sechellia]